MTYRNPTPVETGDIYLSLPCDSHLSVGILVVFLSQEDRKMSMSIDEDALVG